MNASFQDKLHQIAESTTFDDDQSVARDIERLVEAGVNNTQALGEFACRSDEDVGQRQLAVWLLGRIGGPNTDAFLVEASGADAEDIRKQACLSMGLKCGEASRRRLLELADGDADTEVRVVALNALGMCEGSEVADFLIDTLRDEGEPGEVRGSAAEQLANFPGGETEAALISALAEDDDEVRYWACFALSELDVDAAAEELHRLADNDSVERVRHEAKRALGKMAED